MSGGPMATPVFLPGGSSGAPAPPAAGAHRYIVANEAAASALAGTVDGDEIYILTHRSQWMADPTGTAPLQAHRVIARNGGGTLTRTSYSDPAWREEITDIYIDPSNVTGIASDENQGIFDAPQVGAARQPLLTWKELARRWNRRETVTTIDLNFFVNIHVLSDIVVGSDDIAEMDFVAGPETFPQIFGENPTVILGPVALGAFTPANPAVPAPGGAAPTITVGATVWGPFLGKRIRRLSDGSVATVMKDLGGGVARISQPQTSNFATFLVEPTNVAWAPGDTIVVETLTSVRLSDHWQYSCEGSIPFNQAAQLAVVDLRVLVNTFAVWDPVIDGEAFIIFYQCEIETALGLSAPVIYNACTFRNCQIGGNLYAGKGSIAGGALVQIAPFVGSRILISGQPRELYGFGQLDFSAYVQGGFVITRSGCNVGTFAVFDTIAVAIFNPGGHAVLVGGIAFIRGLGDLAIVGAVPIFGTGAVGVGMRVGSGSRTGYTTVPNITGALGDLHLGDSAIGQWGDVATGTYQPPGGLALTWANVAAAAGIAGFGGGAHWIDQDAHLVKASIT